MIKRSKKLIASLMVISVLMSMTSTVFAADNDGWTEANQTEAAKNGAWEEWCEKWENIKNDWTKLSIAPGKDESELNFAWYSKTSELGPKVKISKNADMSNAVEFSGTQSNAVPEYLSNKVTVTGLEENTKYYYSYGTNNNFSEPVEINIQDSSKFTFLLVGDPQIGSSLKNVATGETDAMGQDKAARNDSFNWNNTLNKAISLVPNASFMISAGDQVSIRNKKATTEEALAYTENEIEYVGYLSPNVLKSLPTATTLGNHDAVSGNYSYHFNNPNTSTLGSTVGGGNYYFTYGDTLFINLNTNNRNTAEHKKFIEEAVSNAKDSKWRVVTLHQDIYGSGEHSNEPEIVELRYGLVPLFEENNIDLVLTGHDHTYARSKILKSGSMDESTFISEEEYEEFFEKEFESGYTELVEDEKYLNYLESIQDKEAVVTDLNIQSGKVVDPDGILYITANSASGSKYYDNVPRQQAYIANRWQEDVPTFSTINVDEVSLTINTYRTDNMEKIDETYTIVKSLDKSNLLDLIAKAEAKIKEDYTESTFEVFNSALINAKAVSNQGDATEDIITKAYTDLNVAMDSLVLRGNKTELNKTIEEAKNLLNNENYTEEAKKELNSIIEKAVEISNSNDISQDKVDEMLNELKEGINEFKGKPIINTEKPNNSLEEDKIETNNENEISKPNTNDTNSGNSNVNTGDTSNAYVYIILSLSIASLGVLIINRKKLKKATK